MYTIGITGGIGSGKSEAAKMLADITTATLFISDDIGKSLMEPDGICYETIIKEFGTGIVRPDGSLDRILLAKLIFNDDDKKNKLEGIVHPAVMKYISDYIEKNSQIKGLIIIESAILFESNASALCNETWYIYVEKETRIRRLMQSRGYSLEKTTDMMNSQKDDDFYFNSCDVIINNNSDLNTLKISLNEKLNALHPDLAV